ncbi:hypothetical protein RSAG8_10611, partial [Rhizoctonia solani AG-8 WAC10335]
MVWRISLATSWRAACEPLKLEVKDPKRHFEGNAQFAVSSVSVCSTGPVCVSMKCWLWKSKLPGPQASVQIWTRQVHLHIDLPGAQTCWKASCERALIRRSCGSQQHIDFALTSTMVDGARASALLLLLTSILAGTMKVRR